MQRHCLYQGELAAYGFGSPQKLGLELIMYMLLLVHIVPMVMLACIINLYG